MSVKEILLSFSFKQAFLVICIFWVNIHCFWAPSLPLRSSLNDPDGEAGRGGAGL